MALPLLIPVILKGAAWLAAGSAAAFGIGKFTKESEKNYFNKGICTKCGGHFKRIPGTRVSGNKGYQCDVCDNCVWITFGSDKDYIYTPSKNAKK
jgi:hypothetical protein